MCDLLCPAAREPETQVPALVLGTTRPPEESRTRPSSFITLNDQCQPPPPRSRHAHWSKSPLPLKRVKFLEEEADGASVMGCRVALTRKTSALGLLLCTTGAGGRSAAVYQWLQTCSIIVGVVVHAVSTVPGVTAKHGSMLTLIEGASSMLFALDYLIRLCICREHRKFANYRPFEAQLAWAFTPAGALALIAYPVLSDGTASIHDVLVSLPRLLLLFRTSRWRGAVRTARRVVFVNREILYTSLALVSLTILASATLLYATCSPEERCREENGIIDLPSATYAAAMMLTGQASPEGGKGLPLFQAVVLLTAFLSVPFFAVPAAMLTWGFEGEAQRLAAREAERASRREAYADGGASHIELEEESSDEEFDDYLESLGGAAEDEEVCERAKAI